ncbi:MAG: rhodanese-like domain-containing protein [Rhodovibrio sp.]|nr:rhodanese-like domain-containing protein [Rhodovibrio sp.]
MALFALIVAVPATAIAEGAGLERYVSDFDYAAREEMKVDSQELITLLTQGEAQLIDIRFEEEFAAWSVGPARNVPLPELPGRIDEIDTEKTVVVACPHKDRAIIAMVYLRSQGIQAKYLTSGLIGLAENLRGDAAKSFIQSLPD